MDKMFCYQCEQTAKGVACTNSGVCGKAPENANNQDALTVAMVNLSSAVIKTGKRDADTDRLVVDGLFTCVTNVNFDAGTVNDFAEKVNAKTKSIGGTVENLQLWEGDKDLVSLRSTLLFGLRGMAAYAHHANTLGYKEDAVTNWFYKGLNEMKQDNDINKWLSLLEEFGHINLKCMALLDKANTETYGDPVPTEVTTDVEAGPFIVVTGHDLHDIYMLLEQTKDSGVNIYTHGEMLPSHSYPKLKAYPHLKGNYGTAWQSQQKEFDNLPAPVLFTTNCIMPVKQSYSDRIFTTSVVRYPDMKHIETTPNGQKDFTELIACAKKLGGFKQKTEFSGINGGHTLVCGFGRNAILSNAGTIVDAVKQGLIKRFYLVGGCDGAKPGRNYYTEFVKQTAPDTVILTLACGKFRFNDLDLGKIGPFPRILDVGQCNDAYAAIEVAIALSKAFECGVNDLPLTLVLSWYEQKAVCILLTLLALGIKNIFVGPSVPAFFSENVLNVLVEKYNLTPISTPEEDLKKIAARK